MGTPGGAVGMRGGAGDEDIRHHAVAALGVLNGSARRLFTESMGACSSVEGCMKILTMRLDNGYALGTYLKVCLEVHFHLNFLTVE
jgi:hypothetical protein